MTGRARGVRARANAGLADQAGAEMPTDGGRGHHRVVDASRLAVGRFGGVRVAQGLVAA